MKRTRGARGCQFISGLILFITDRVRDPDGVVVVV
jgi:hypothetical protein